jgi:superfamily II DNA or RNA helicase
MSITEVAETSTAASSTDGSDARTSTDGLPQVPEPGQVVEVRGSTWAVTDVREQGLPRSPSDESAAGLNHVVGLQSLDEDRLGSELSVVWELEVGHTVAPDQGLPETIGAGEFDDPNTLAAFVDAVRWGAVTSADPNSYQAPFRSGATVEPYQLEPLRRALQAPRANLLLADDVGLGKTIEAGLVIQELLLRHRARTAIIVCPPSLALKWQDEMAEKFGLDFTIVDSDLMAQVRRTYGLGANPFKLFPRVIVSMAWLPGLRAQRLLRDVYAQSSASNSARRYAFDMLIVDEAHHVAPSSPSVFAGARGYAVDSQRTIATRELAERCEHRLFLSATPHNGHSESFTALLEMIDDRRFQRGAQLDEQALREVAVRRLKTEIKAKNFHPRAIKPLPFEPSADEQDAFDRLDQLLRTNARAHGRRGSSSDLLAILLKKRFLSSPWAFGTTMSLYDGARRHSDLFATIDDEEDYYTELLGSDQNDEEEGAEHQPESTALRASTGGDPLAGAAPEQISQLAAWGQSYQHQPDSRLQALITFLDGVCRPDGKHWSNERVAVFTEYASTLEWIADNLAQHGYGDRVAIIQGSTPPDERELTRERFSTNPADEPVRVLLATDAAGEGIDLQDYCHRLVNFDIPFNPSRLEQRIGRIDRYGQRHTPEIFHFVPATGSSTYRSDLDFMRTIAEKVGNIAVELGSVNQVIDTQIQDHFSRVDRRRTKAKPEDGNAIITRTLAGGMELNRRLTELSHTYADTKQAMHLTPENSRRVVDTALQLSAQPQLIPSGDDRTDAAVFEVPALGSAWQPAIGGLETRLHPGVFRQITFDEAAFDADGATELGKDLVHVHLGHPLLQKSARILRSSLFSSDSDMNRVTAVVVDDLEQSCVAAVSRLVLVGRGGLRLHEEVFLTGIRIRGQQLAEAKVEALLESALDREDLELADGDLRSQLARRWNSGRSALRDRLLRAMSRRAEDRQQAITDRLLQRRQADTDRAREIFAAFRANLRESHQRLLADELEVSQQLFADDQQQQRRKDIRAMEERLDNLDEEERREISAIEDRYTDIRPHVSAAAVIFALTPDDARTGEV